MSEKKLKNSLEDLVFVAHKQFEKIVESQGKFFAARIACGQTLLELRTRIESGEAGHVGWWAWYGEHFARSRRDAERVMELASQENPQQAHEEAKADNRQAVAKHRELNHATYVSRKNNATESKVEDERRPNLKVVKAEEPQSTIRRGLIDEAIEVCRQMNRAERIEFVMQFRKIYRDC